MIGFTKIGVIINQENNSLKNWKLELIYNLINSINCEVTIIEILDISEDLKGKRTKIFNTLVAFYLYRIQTKIEKLIYENFNYDKINQKLKGPFNIAIKCNDATLKGKLHFSEENYERINAANLDIIVDLQGFKFSSKYLELTTNGFLQILFSDSNEADYPYSLKEITNKEAYCTSSLIQFNPEFPNGTIINKATYNWFWSFYKTQLDLQQQAIILLRKSLNDLREKNIKYRTEPFISNCSSQISTVIVLKYLFNFYKNIFKYKIHNTLPLGRLDCWTLNIGEGEFIKSDLSAISSIDMPKDVFWADPFLFKYNNKYYVFFENLPYKNMVGKISVGEVKKNENGKYSLENVTDVICKDYHLSYPFIFEEDNEIFMIPETGGNKRLEVYICVNFPDKWELYSTAFDGEIVTDVTYFKDANNHQWIFLNRGVDLYIYQIDSLKFKKIDSHLHNPVSMDCRKSRNAGAIFKINDDYIRPNQANTFGVYGRALRLSKIINLNLNIYEEEELTVIEPHFCKGVIGIHHLHQVENMFVFDSCYKKY